MRRTSIVFLLNAVLASLALGQDTPLPRSHVNLHGEALPEGAFVRLGTSRLRFVHHAEILVPTDGKTIIAFAWRHYRAFDAESGRALHEGNLPTGVDPKMIVFGH